MKSLLQHREGDTMIKIAVETQSATVDFRDILEACEVKPDESADAPWDNADGYEHEVITDKTEGFAAGSFRDFHGHMMRVITSEFEDWGSAGRGASKQVEFEAHAAEVKRTVEQLARWHAHGWQVWGIVCNFQGYRDSCWGFYDDDSNSPYMRESIAEIAGNVAAAMEKDGFTVENKPQPERINRESKLARIRYNMALQNFKG